MKNKLITNCITNISKIEVFNFRNLGKVALVNDRYLLCTDEDLPLGVDLHLYLPSRKSIFTKQYNGGISKNDSRLRVERAYLEINGNFIRIQLKDIAIRHSKSIRYLKRFYPQINKIPNYEYKFTKAYNLEHPEDFTEYMIRKSKMETERWANKYRDKRLVLTETMRQQGRDRAKLRKIDGRGRYKRH